jgi:hypothetical protein
MTQSRPIRKDPDIMSLLSRLPLETASSLTDTQLVHIKIAIGSGQYRKHKIDVRGTLPVPFKPYRVYFVLLMGRNVRDLSRQEISITIASLLILSSLFMVISSLLGLVILYLLKSALGINLLDGFSLGLWEWYKTR